MSIEQANGILALIVTETSALGWRVSGSRRTLAEQATAIAVEGDRAREIAPWIQLGTELSLTDAEMAGDDPLPVVEVDEQAAEILALVRDRMAALRHQLNEPTPLDETDPHALATGARLLIQRAATLRMVSVVADVLGEGQEEVPLSVLAAARRSADRRATAALAALRRGVVREVGRGRERREVAREAGVTPATLYSWVPADEPVA